MKIHEVNLVNFRVFEDVTVAFPDRGVIGVTGTNEAGKSTLLEGMAWVLFGTKAIRGKVSGVRWRHAPARRVAAGTLKFSVGGVDYVAHRTESDASLTIAGQVGLLAATTSGVDAAVPKLIGMTLKEFSATYLCSQDDLARIGSMGPTERQTFYRRVLKVEVIDLALKMCREHRNKEKVDLDALVRTADPVTATVLEANLVEYKQQAETAEAEHAALTAKVDALSPKLAGLSADIEVARADADAHKTYCANRDQLAAARDAAYQRAQAATATADALEGGLARADTLQAELDAMEPVDVEALLDAQKNVTAKYQAMHRARGARRDAALVEHTNAKALLAGTVAQAERIHDHDGGPCPWCDRPLTGTDAQEGIYERLMGVAATQRQGVESTGESYAALIADTPEEMALVARSNELADAIVAARRAAGEREAKTRAIKAAASDRDKHSTARAVEVAAMAERARMVDQLTELVEVEHDPSGLATATAALSVAKAEIAGIEEQVAMAVRLRVSATKSHEDAATRLERAKKHEADMSRVAESVDAHDGAEGLLTDLRTSSVTAIRPELEGLVSGFVAILSDGRHDSAIVDDTYDVTMNENGLPMEVVSGGAQRIKALAVRLAVSHMIAGRAGHPMQMLILDEPFGSLDDVRRNNVVGLLRRLTDVFEQVFIVSHVPEIKDIADTTITIVHDPARMRSTAEVA